MSLCRYCNQKISWFGGIDHSVCEANAKNHKSNIHAYIKRSILEGTFDIRNTSKEFNKAEKYLSANEVQKAIAYGYDAAVINIIDDTIVDNEEEKNWSAFRENLETNLNQTFGEVSEWLNIYDTDKLLHMAITLNKLKKGQAPDNSPPSSLMLTKGEKFLYSWSNIGGHALNVKKKYKGSSTGGSYRLTKKFSLRHNQFRGKPVIYSEWDSIGSGELTLTNKYLCFLGYGKTRDIKEKLSSIISLDPTDDGFIVNIDLKTRPAYRFSMQSSKIAWMASNIILNAQT